MNERVTVKNSPREDLLQGKGRKVPYAAKSRNEDAWHDAHLRFERLISDLSARFLSVEPDQVDGEIEQTLEHILKFFQVDRCGLLGISPDRKRLHVTHAAYAEGISEVPKEIDLACLFPWAHEKLVVRGEYVSVSNMSELPPEAEKDRQTWMAMGVQSSLVIPLVFECRVSSLIVIGSLRRQYSWPPEYIPRLRLLGEIFINALERRRVRLQLEEQLRFEMLLTEISGRFVNMPADQVDHEIEDAQRRVCECLGLDLSALWQWSIETPRILTMTHLYRPLGGPPLPEPMYAHEYFPWCQQQLEAGRVISVSSMEALPDEAARDKEVWLSFGIKTTLTFPLSIGGATPIGAVSFNTMKQERTWPEALIQRLQLVAQVFSNALIRKQTEMALRESEARLRLATESVEAGLWSMDVDTGSFWASPKSRELFHFGPDEELHYGNYFSVIHPDDRERVHGAVQHTLRSREKLKCDYRIVLPDGRVRWILSRGQCFLNPAGEPDRMIGLSLDITERKLAEAAQTESMERYRAIVEAFEGFIYICSPDYRVEFMNQRLIERTGRNAVGELCYKALHDLDTICEWCVNERVFHGETVRWEVQSPKDSRWYHVANTPIRHADGTVSKQSAMVDVTERKQAEEVLKEKETALRNSQKDLRKLAGKLISAQEDELRQLSRELHDDLTQRLAVIAIDAGKLEIELKNMPQIHEDSTQKIAQVKEQLILVSEDVHRISRQLHPTILDDLGLVRALESECAALMRRDNVEITFRREDIPDIIPNDIALCLYRVVQEGLRNCITHSCSKSFEINLKGAEDSICLTVWDEGVGFDPQEVRHKPGLGLSSMRERVQFVCGDISIKSLPGQGTVIRVCIPLKKGGA